MDRPAVGTARIIRADSRDLPLPDDSVDLVVTSPPYFALRSYQDGGEHYEGQIGDEPTPAEFVDSLLEVTRECVRVLKPSGSLWVNLGDKYAQAEERSRNGNGNRKAIDNFTSGAVLGKSCNRCGADAPRNPCPYSDVPCEPRFTREKTVTLGRKDNGGVRQKSLIGIPWRYALRCIDDLGLILRAEVIWSKPNGLPESVTDRVRRSHETWFHMTLNPRYFSAVDEIREEVGRQPNASERVAASGSGLIPGASHRWNGTNRASTGPNPLGKLPGSVWTVPTQPLQVPAHLGVDHFAAFPMEWPRRIIQGWSAPGMTVLDPFGGTGTTALVAKALGRLGISVDMSADYCRLAEWRTNDPGELARAMRVEKPAPQIDGQLGLLDLDGGAA